MPTQPGWLYELTPGTDALFASLNFDLTAVFTDPRIQIWRDLPERQNCLLETNLPAPHPRRLHIKRFRPEHALEVQLEVAAIRLLERNHIPTVPLLAWGANAQEWSFLITADLSSHLPADRALQRGLPFSKLAEPVASLAARLHQARLRHQDLYLCHFFVNPAAPELDLHLIDPGRVSPFRRPQLRWIVKDLAQLLYSLRSCNLDPVAPGILLDLYFRHHPHPLARIIRTLLPLKIAAIARHDARLRQRTNRRHVSIPDAT